jgi:V/A-type H+-transporting ATPase subunit I
MLRPRKMSRVLIAGPAVSLKPAVEALHRAGALHITDYNEQYEGFRLGAPMAEAGPLSEKLLKLRSASKVLGIDPEAAPPQGVHGGGAAMRQDELIAKLESEVAAKEEERQQLDGRLQEARRTVEALKPFTALPLRLESYQQYEGLAVFVGIIKTPVEAGLARLTPRMELFFSEDRSVLALFIDRKFKAQAEKVLAQNGFTEAKLPGAEGDPRQLLEQNQKTISELERKMADLAGELASSRQKYMGDILACQEKLGIEVEKAEAPLRFATTRSSFFIEGWIPSDEVDRTENSLLKGAGTSVYLERMEEREWMEELGGEGPKQHGQAPAHTHGEEAAERADPFESVPVALSNPRPVKPFEMLTEMFSTPGYKEIDPTITMALVFPFFFGLMIGDLAYGILLATTGVIFMTKLKRFEGFRELGWYILWAGMIAALFGLFVFGDAFGLPFHSVEGEGGASVPSWSEILGVDIPLKASVHKLEASGLGNLLMFSIVAAVVHLSLGNIFGIINEWKHSKKHAAAKVGWLFMVLGFGFLILKFGQATSLGSWLWGGPLWPFSPSLDTGMGILVPYASVVFLLAGIVLVIGGEGAMALTEVMGVFSNILSYTRLGAIGVAKGAMAFAFNILIIPLVTGGNIGLAIVGWVFLVLAHMLVFVLGGLSSGIQALRLNLVEFFMKFYKGGGIRFNPFGKAVETGTEKTGA